MSHTPGPWVVDIEYARGPRGGRRHDGRKTMLMVVAERGGMPGLIVNSPPIVNETDEANARLIAAAPDLLEALRDAVLQIEYLHDKFQHTSSGEAAIVRAQIAIAKAEGK